MAEAPYLPMAGSVLDGGIKMGIHQNKELRTTLWVGLCLLGLLLVCYANSFKASWQYDDFANIVHNSRIHMTKWSWSQVKAGLNGGMDYQVISRPLAYLSFALNHRLSGLDVTGYHIVNLSIHWLASLILFLFIRDTLCLPVLRRKYESRAVAIALIATVMWACHPIQVTAVTYVVQRMTEMAGLYYILAMYGYLLGRRTSSRRERVYAYGGCGLSAICALLTKENAVLLLYALLMYDLLFFQPLNRQTIRKWLLLAVGITVLLFVTSWLFMNPLKVLTPYTNRPFNMFERVLTQPRVLFIYLSLLAVPMTSRMSILHDVGISHSLSAPWTTLPSIVGLVLCILLLGLLASKHRLFAFCGLFFFLNHMVESSILNLELIYEHRNYIPSMLLFVPFAVAVVRSFDFFYYRRVFQLMVAGGAALVFVSNAHTTWSYNRIFLTEYSLWHHTLSLYPKLSLAYNNIGKVYWSHGEYEKSHRQILKAVELNRFNDSHQKAVAYYNLGLYAANVERDFKIALDYFQTAQSIYPDYPKTWYEIARVQMQMANFEAAAAVLHKAHEKWPRHSGILDLMGINFLKQRRYEEAIQIATAALKEASENDHRTAWMVAAQSYRAMCMYPTALNYLKKILETRPDDTAALMASIEVCADMGQLDLADAYVGRLKDSKGLRTSRARAIEVKVRNKNILPYVPDEHFIAKFLESNG